MRAPEPSRLASLASKTDDWFARANAALLSQVPCRAGCSHCCIGPFPITRLDVDHLQEGLNSLPPDQRSGIERRASEQVSALEAAYSRLQQSRYLDRWPDRDIDQLTSDFHRFPCPALDAGRPVHALRVSTSHLSFHGHSNRGRRDGDRSLRGSILCSNRAVVCRTPN